MEQADYGSDAYFMQRALDEARQAVRAGEIPVGAIVVAAGRIIARGHNLTETLCDVTAHAEMQAITAAAGHLGGKYLPDCTLYVTLEPCAMCAGALYWAQLGRLVFGAEDPRRGYRAMGGRLHPKTEVTGGVLAGECKELLDAFFQKLR
ncbi:MAG TPA: nucleoside deaminase [Candidatus Merdimorpha stercoravium]|uniref:tRNA-specific adenosine deaminase n=1 Tax=Candidatus Merdimorpha stercoravium TaxID=2840863 RepID=A0A9D1KTX1_9FLAO|nr:nucleoside deaminase [Candidatus Merdimorpha stercoravium]